MSSERVPGGLTHTEGGRNWAKRWDDELGKIVTDCLVCDTVLRVSHGKREDADEKYKLTFIESTEERQYQRFHEGYFCSKECLIEYLTEKNQNSDAEQ